GGWPAQPSRCRSSASRSSRRRSGCDTDSRRTSPLRRWPTWAALAGGREGERPALQPAQGESEPISLPSKDLQSVPATVPTYEQVAAQRVPGQVIPAHGLKPVETLAPVLRLNADPDSVGQPQGQHGRPCPPGGPGPRRHGDRVLSRNQATTRP